MSKSRFKKYNKTSTYSRAVSAVILYCIEYELPVELVFLDESKELVKILELTDYEMIVKNIETEKESIVYKHCLKRVNIEGSTRKYIEEYRKDIGSLKE